MKKRFLIIALFPLIVNGQSDEIIKAFSESYSLEAVGNFAKAIQEIDRVYDENYYEMNLRLGWLYYNLGNYFESKNKYEKAVNQMPYAIEAKLGYVLPVSAMGNWDEVVKTYEKILEIDPQNSLVNYRMGAIFYERKQYEKALNFCEKTVNLYPFDYDSVILLAWIHYQKGDLREAGVLFKKSMLIKSNNASAEYGLSLIK
ncbi:MAG: tetratricopeptide repeat protein [Cyclobacteriaceae bacterium]|nr:tetratricopeptide repeat protein [Cyclobacteriaceae bacterium]